MCPHEKRRTIPGPFPQIWDLPSIVGVLLMPMHACQVMAWNFTFPVIGRVDTGDKIYGSLKETTRVPIGALQ